MNLETLKTNWISATDNPELIKELANSPAFRDRLGAASRAKGDQKTQKDQKDQKPQKPSPAL